MNWREWGTTAVTLVIVAGFAVTEVQEAESAAADSKSSTPHYNLEYNSNQVYPSGNYEMHGPVAGDLMNVQVVSNSDTDVTIRWKIQSTGDTSPQTAFSSASFDVFCETTPSWDGSASLYSPWGSPGVYMGTTWGQGGSPINQDWIQYTWHCPIEEPGWSAGYRSAKYAGIKLDGGIRYPDQTQQLSLALATAFIDPCIEAFPIAPHTQDSSLNDAQYACERARAQMLGWSRIAALIVDSFGLTVAMQVVTPTPIVPSPTSPPAATHSPTTTPTPTSTPSPSSSSPSPTPSSSSPSLPPPPSPSDAPTPLPTSTPTPSSPSPSHSPTGSPTTSGPAPSDEPDDTCDVPMFLREDRMEHVRQTHFNGGEDVDKTKSIWGIDGFRGLTLTEDNLWHDLFEDAQEAKGHLQGNGRCYREWTYLEGGFIGTLGEKYGYSYTRTYTVVYLQTGGLWTMFPGTNDSIQGT